MVVTTTTSIPFGETSPTTTVAPNTTTTTAPKSGKAPSNSKAPGRNKAVTTPTEFTLGYRTINSATSLVATWIDDQSPESYVIECTKSQPTPTAVPTTRYMVERGATVLNADNKMETVMTVTPSESNFCWVVAYIGTDASARSNPARVNTPPSSGTQNRPDGVPQPPANAGNNNNNNNNNNNKSSTSSAPSSTSLVQTSPGKSGDKGKNNK